MNVPDRILDAASELFVSNGVAAVTMSEVAERAGCSRATVYRYFDDRDAIRRAFVHREARRVAAVVAEQVASIAEPAQKLVEAIMASVSSVRSQPALLAWFTGPNFEATRQVVSSSEVIDTLAGSILSRPFDPELASWLVRVVMSLILLPGDGEEAERAQLRRFVAPLVQAVH